MKNKTLLLLIGAGLIITMPFKASANAPQQVSPNSQGETNVSIAQSRRDRQFTVYYRSRGDRQWTLEGYHPNRRDAEAAARRLERRGYRTYVQLSRRV
jgi:hypothetical protein